MFRYAVLTVSLLLVLAACSGSDTGSDSAAANAGDDGGSVVATTVTQPATTTAQDQAASTSSTPPSTSTTTEAATPTTTQPVPKGPSEVLLAIQNRGVINVGTTRSFATFENFETGLVAAVVDVLVPGIEVAYSDVAAGDRFRAVVNGDIDMGVMLTTATVTRQQEQGIAFSQPYLLMGTVALVSADSGMVSIGDLDGKTIAVMDGTSTMLMLEDALAQANVSATLEPYGSIFEVVDALSSGAVDAAARDWGSSANKILIGEPLSMIPIDLLREPQAIFTAASDPAFAADVRAALQTVIDDGIWLALFEFSFGGPPPWTVEEMLAVPPEDR